MKFYKIFIYVLPLIFFGCGESGSSKSSESSESMNGNGEIEVSTGEERKDLLTSYLELKDALVQSNVDETKIAADHLLAATGQADPAFEKAIMNVAGKIKNADNIDVQRENFEQLSLLIYGLAGNGQFSGTKLYKQFCPMAFNNKGAFWLSMDEEIVNPYFGEKMLHCGKVEEVLE